MAKISCYFLTFCLISYASAGIVPKFMTNRAVKMLPDGVGHMMTGPAPLSEEFKAAKRFVLESEMGGDENKIKKLKIELYNILHEDKDIKEGSSADQPKLVRKHY